MILALQSYIEMPREINRKWVIKMLIQDNLVLTRSDPSGMGGVQLIYRMENYGLTAVNRPQEEISQIHWEVEVVKFKDDTV